MSEKEISQEKIVEFNAGKAAYDALVGSTLGGHLKILSYLGSGGMSVVYKAEDLLLQRIVAVKILHSHSALNPQNVLRFRQEAMAASKIDHPNVIRIYEFNVPDEGQPYLVMDYIEGLSLADFIAKNGPIEMRRAVSLMEIICDGLQCAHDAGVVHRDLKPGNIMLLKDATGKQTLKIVDFGIAKILTEDTTGHALTQTGEVFGSPLYMSPEQCHGKTLDSRSDLYSLGCVMYEMCTGQPPIKGASLLETIQLQTTDMPAPSSSKYPGIKYGAPFDLVIQRAMAKSPDERFGTATEFKQALRNILTGPSSNARATSPIDQKKLLVACGAILSIVVTFLLYRNTITSVEKPQPPIVSKGANQGSPNEPAENERQATTDAELAALFQKPSSQQPSALIIEHSAISDDGLKVIANNPKIVRLRAASTQITDLSGPTLASLPNLQKLNVCSTLTGDSLLKTISTVPHLYYLWCAGTRVTDDGMTYVAKMPMQQLNLTETAISDAGLAKLKGLQLVDLRQTKTHVTGKGLGYLKGLQSLRTLLTGKNAIGSEGAGHISTMTNLEHLGLEAAGLTDADVKQLTTLKHLEVLNLNNNDLSALTMQYVSELPKLHKLHIAKSNIPRSAIEEYKLAHPQVTIIEKLDSHN